MSRISSASANHNKFIVSGSIAKLNLKRPNSQKEESSRAILVPGHNLKIFPSVWKKRDFRRVQTASKIVTKEERERQVERFEEDRKRLEWESKQRTLFLQEIDKAREEKFRNKIGQLSDDEENKTTKVLDRVSQAKNEEVVSKSTFDFDIYYFCGLFFSRSKKLNEPIVSYWQQNVTWCVMLKSMKNTKYTADYAKKNYVWKKKCYRNVKRRSKKSNGKETK